MLSHRSSPVGVVQMNPLALVMEDPHEYEDINEVLGRLPAVPGGSSEEEVVTTPCPAYISTTRQPQLDDMEYEVIPATNPGPAPEGEGLASADDASQKSEASECENV